MFKGGILAFIKSKLFLKNIIVYILLLCISGYVLLSWLDGYTKHGEYIKVPNFKGVKISELDTFSEQNKVTYLIVDSIYDAKAIPGVVIKQEPENNAEVKEGREVYLYVSALLPMEIPMPKLIDRSLRQAISMINAYGLRLGKIEFVEDECTNCVLAQKVRGREIKSGKIISKGSVIDLVAGKGMRDIKMGLPCLYGLTRNEAILKLAESSLAVGVVHYNEEKDDNNSRVYKQVPSCDTLENIAIGSVVDIFLTVHKNKIPVANVDTLSNITPEDAKDFDK
jgi:beta-lactam-binding protein with PASTA domain